MLVDSLCGEQEWESKICGQKNKTQRRAEKFYPSHKETSQNTHEAASNL